MSEYQVEYLIVGAGPAGLQLAYFLEKKKRSYLILERGKSVGTFFREFPRHRKLISINKVHTGYNNNSEINLRWDWNSLISNDETLRLSKYSKDYFPHTDALISYLEDYANQLQLKTHFNTEVIHVSKNQEKFQVIDQNKNLYTSDRLIIATGVSKPYIPPIPGIELAENYTTISLDTNDFINQRVLIIGKGNSGFETADHLISAASLIHVVSPTPIKMAWRTKYVGHLRAVNNNFLDTYQLKSQNGILDAEIVKIEQQDEKFEVTFNYTHANNEQEMLVYDRVIVCTGFQFDHSIFDETCRPMLTINDRFPAQTSEWESVNIQGLYFAGVLMHMRDFKKKQSGFIHGFRHNIQALYHILEHKYQEESIQSQKIRATPEAITTSILKRVNSSAGLWQQTGFLCDLIIVDAEHKTAQHYQDLPRDYIHGSALGTSSHYYVITLEFGDDVAEVSEPFSINRVHKDDVENSDESAFIHPIIRHYRHNYLVEEHHIIEDLEAEWRESVHIEPLRAFLQKYLAVDISVTSFDKSETISLLNNQFKLLPFPKNIESLPKLNLINPNNVDPCPDITEGEGIASRRKRIGEYLIEAGLITSAQLSYALLEQKKNNVRIGEIIVNQGWLNQKTIDFLVEELCLAS